MKTKQKSQNWNLEANRDWGCNYEYGGEVQCDLLFIYLFILYNVGEV